MGSKAVIGHMPLIILFLWLVLQSVGTTAQTRQETIRTSASQVQLGEAASEEIQNLFPEAIEAFIFKDGAKEALTINYNLLFDHFYFTDRSGRTIWISTRDVDSVHIGDYLFLAFGDEGFFRAVPGKPELLVKYKLDISTETLTRGAYGTTDETASIEVLRAMTTPAAAHGLIHTAYLENPGGQELRITLKREEKFYVLGEEGVQDASNRRALQRAFPGHRREIRRFARNNDIDFGDPDDLASILEYISTLE